MKKIKIAITGRIGSGKTAVADFIRANGFAVVSCDEVYRKLLQKRKMVKIIKENFPSVVEGNLVIGVNRKALAEIVFNDPEKLKLLNTITHPLIMAHVEKEIKRARGKIVFVEVPLLFETGFDKRFDRIIVVMRNEEDCIKGVMQRNFISEKQAKLRLINQVDYDALDLTPYTVIHNTKDIKSLVEEVTEVINAIKKEYE